VYTFQKLGKYPKNVIESIDLYGKGHAFLGHALSRVKYFALKYGIFGYKKTQNIT
jgi:hypothetical protein